MKLEEFLEFIDCKGAPDDLRVRSRERRNLEFKSDLDANCLAKSLKTIAAFGSLDGGCVVFGVQDGPRMAIGVENNIDEARIQDQLFAHLYPVPEIELYEFDVSDKRLICLRVEPVFRKPVIAIKDKQTQSGKNETVLRAGTVYYRRAGRTKPITGEEFSSILEKRDGAIRSEILGFISRGSEVGFDRAVIADFRRAGAENDKPTLFVPRSEAHRLNIVDRAKLVESEGAPAYQIAGTVELTMPTSKDPRKPLLPEDAARVLRGRIHEILGKDFPWKAMHLRKAATHLGYWDTASGDNIHTGEVEITGRPVYYEQGRAAIERFANRTPAEFVDAVASKDTKRRWEERQAPLVEHVEEA